MNRLKGRWRWSTLSLAGPAVLLGSCDGGPTQPPLQPTLAISAPSAPSHPSAVAVAFDTLKVSWNDNSTNESGFQVHRSTTGSSGTYSLRATRPANARAFRDTQVAPLTSYCYKIRAFRTVDGETKYSAFTSAVCATTPAAPRPTASSETVAKPASSTSVDVSWIDGSSNETGFRVKRSIDGGSTWTTAATVGANVTAYQDGGRGSEQPVCYRVVAFNAAGTSSSNTDCTTPPAAPTNLAASAAAQGGINLTWADNSAAEDGYQVQRSTDGTTYSTIANLAANATSYADAQVTSNTKYWYRVRAKKDSGFSDFSDVASATAGGTSAGPAAPSGTNVTPTASDRVLITWIDNSDNEERFRIEQSETSAGPWWDIGWLFGSGFTSHTTSVPSERQVCYRVIALNGQGESTPSNSDCTTAPARPTGLTAVGATGPAIEIKWTDNSSAEDGYQVQRRLATSLEPRVIVAELPANATSYHDVSVTGDQTYSYIIRAKKDGGVSNFSNEASAAAATAAPNAPSDPKPVPTSSTAVSLAWRDNSSNEEGFRIERSTDGGGNWILLGTVPWWGQPFSDAGLTSEQEVCYRVTAFNAQGASAASNVGCTVPPRGPIVSLVPIDQTTADLVWSDNSAVEDSYQIWYLDGWSMGLQFLTELPANSTSYRLTGNPYWYEYWVAATNDGGRSDYGRAWADPPPAESSSSTSLQRQP